MAVLSRYVVGCFSCWGYAPCSRHFSDEQHVCRLVSEARVHELSLLGRLGP